MIIRIQSRIGTKRLDSLTPSTSLAQLFHQLAVAHSIVDTEQASWTLYRDRKRQQPLVADPNKTLADLGLDNGDILYLQLAESEPAMQQHHRNDSQQQLAANSSEPKSEPKPSTSINEDAVDKLLAEQDGRIERSRDERRCRHGANGRCLYCTPIEPFDDAYLQSRDPPVKHLSFHSYIRKMQSGADRGKFLSLEEPSCRVRPGCQGHQPWPDGICTKCQPKPLTLNRQTYRHVDHIMFENSTILDGFLHFFRETGCQRVGFLYGTYEATKDVPLGIRATVAAIYEPPQRSSAQSLELLDDAHEARVEQLAAALGLRRVGWIFSDLEALDIRQGTVKCLRGASTYFLSAEECLQAAHYQCQHPNVCRHSVVDDQRYGSKFVTVVCSGDRDNHIHFEGYQVSNQCAALVRDQCVVPTLDAPQLAYVKESSGEQYVPDVFYKEKDSYGNEVTRIARPFPVEYLIIDVPTSVPKEMRWTFGWREEEQRQGFPVENRSPPTKQALQSYLGQFLAGERPVAFFDFHLLVFLATGGGGGFLTRPLDDAELEALCAAVREKDIAALVRFACGQFWSETMESLENGGGSTVAAGSSAAAAALPAGDTWPCPHCTYINARRATVCEVCGLPPTG